MRNVQILGIDAGGTMTDTILIDEGGQMVIGKAATTPHDESIGFVGSLADALGWWDMTPEEVKRLDDISAPPRLYPHWMFEFTKRDRMSPPKP